MLRHLDPRLLLESAFRRRAYAEARFRGADPRPARPHAAPPFSRSRRGGRGGRSARLLRRSKSPWRVLTLEEGETAAAICERLIPADEFPGAVWAGAVTFIDRQLDGHLRKYRKDYAKGLAAIDQAARKQLRQALRGAPAGTTGPNPQSRRKSQGPLLRPDPGPHHAELLRRPAPRRQPRWQVGIAPSASRSRPCAAAPSTTSPGARNEPETRQRRGGRGRRGRRRGGQGIGRRAGSAWCCWSAAPGPATSSAGRTTCATSAPPSWGIPSVPTTSAIRA